VNRDEMHTGKPTPRLTPDEINALDDAIMDDRDRAEGYAVLGPGGTNGNTPTRYEVVQSILADREASLRAALVVELEDERNECMALMSIVGDFNEGRSVGTEEGFDKAIDIVRCER